MTEILLESWDRQVQMLGNLAGLVTEPLRTAKPSEDGMTLAEQLCHVHEVRYHWLGKTSPTHQALLGEVLRQVGDDWVPIDNLEEIRNQLSISAKAVRDAVSEAIHEGKIQLGPYDHPIFFLQHMLWHEGYHFALILLALRNAGAEPPEEWQEKHVWRLWRDS
jgi:uncharacterized damage-inducible protein DinB